MREVYTKYIEKSLTGRLAEFKSQFSKSMNQVGTKYCVIDNLLPDDDALQIANSFPKTNEMRHISSIRENKFTSKEFDKFNKKLSDVTFSLQSDNVISLINTITGIENQIPDPTLYAGGLSAMTEACFLNPHIDNPHDSNRKNYRRLNLLYYVSPDWIPDYGGNLELWDRSVKKKITIFSKFNRLVLMETNPWSWHSVSKVKVSKSRQCVSNYFFSKESPLGVDYFNITSFAPREDQKLLKPIFFVDNFIRSALRQVKPLGFGQKDVYKGK